MHYFNVQCRVMSGDFVIKGRVNPFVCSIRANSFWSYKTRPSHDYSYLVCLALLRLMSIKV